MAKQNIDIEVRGVDRGANGLLDGLAQKAKQLRREDRLSGETALGGALSKNGIAGFGLSALGYGAAGIAADFVGRGLASSSKALLDAQLLKKDANTMAADLLKSLPVIGGFAQTIETLYDMATGMSKAIQESKLDEAIQGGRLSFFNSAGLAQRALGQGLLASQAGSRIAGMFGDPIAQRNAAFDEQARLLREQAEHEKTQRLAAFDASATAARDAFAKRRADIGTPSTGESAIGALENLNPSFRMAARENQARLEAERMQQLAEVNKDADAFEVTARQKRADLILTIEKKLDEDLNKLGYTRAEFNKKLEDDRVEQARRIGLSLADSEANVTAMRMQAAQHFYEAQDVLEKQSLADKVSDLKRQAQLDMDAGAEKVQRQKQLAMQITAANDEATAAGALRNRQRLDRGFDSDNAAEYQNQTSFAAILRRAGRGADAERTNINASFTSAARELAKAIANPDSSAYERQAKLATLANLAVGRDVDLANVGGVGFSGRYAPATSTVDRFSTGASEALLNRPAEDTARNTKDLVKSQADMLAELKEITKNTSGTALSTKILSAVGP